MQRDESQEAVEEPFDPAETDAAAEAAAAAQEADELDTVAALEQDILKWKDLAMRGAADLENFRKRAAREREESVRYANQSLLEELLPILDNFEMGMQAAEQEKGSMVFIGMSMVRKQLDDFLGNCGATVIEAAGKPFDPNLHDAVSQEESSEVEEGTVLRVTRRGYLLRDRLLRPASVVVAKAPESAES
ncbi:molecular chaperone GrpE [Haloferula luteola]|uniref:Protein GrpE n=1 Tax=Haloferula luteola TaxID=595692 RepID=A0A840UXL9_9BACT|nr:nucleotide exchange factor GrpE [Haloferula luteola]MBB5350522.1 molecular chaperone GrpE [Haloferula luteola]